MGGGGGFHGHRATGSPLQNLPVWRGKSLMEQKARAWRRLFAKVSIDAARPGHLRRWEFVPPSARGGFETLRSLIRHRDGEGVEDRSGAAIRSQFHDRLASLRTCQWCKKSPARPHPLLPCARWETLASHPRAYQFTCFPPAFVPFHNKIPSPPMLSALRSPLSVFCLLSSVFCLP